MNEMRVQDLMTRDVVTVSPDASISEAAARLVRARISAAPVVEGGEVIGIISESDIVAALSPPDSRGRRLSVLDYMIIANDRRARRHRLTPCTVRQAMNEVVFRIAPEASIWEAAAAMQRQGVKRLPVTNQEGRLVGIISKADLVRAMARDDRSIEADIKHALSLLGEGASRVHVDVAQGEATLTGLTNDGQAIRKANDLAARTPGVVRVRNLIDLEPEELPTTLSELSEPSEPELKGLDPWIRDRRSSA
ncbi:MAG TPA: CBS domain-containing protein [Actinomycetota bacterium]|jgi:CBS domain-containing protein